ncbi:MAG: hypothetical protein EHM12_09250 [Dehalococcoidia bacterium]|nr:MAG: hypothetical protein EHM12_09250 [Dehalococcoidia bacterium]
MAFISKGFMRPKSWVLGSIFIALISFLCLYFIVTQLWPDPDTVFAWPQLLLLAFLFLGLSAAATPLSAYLNYRFAKPGWFDRDKMRLTRQGLGVGFLGVLLVYLHLIRALNWTIVLVMAGVFVLIEAFFLTRE